MAIWKLPSDSRKGFTINQTSFQTHFPFFMLSLLFSLPFSTNSLSRQLFRHFRCRKLLRVHLRLLVLLSFPFAYFFIFSPRHSAILKFFLIIFFSIALLVCINLAIPRLPSSIRLFLVRSNLFSPSSAAKPAVIWSIGSKSKSEKRMISGSWVRAYSNGDVYEGEFYRGKCSGSGVFHYHMSGRYEGDWIDEKYDGYGVETWAKGSRYRGQYSQGLRHGIGIYWFFNGDVYAGEWSNGQSHGLGVHTCRDGSRYVGEFKWGVKHGFGHYHFRNGDTYAGEYFGDKMNGFGVYRFGNRHRYEGAWHEGRRQGLGLYTFRKGETQSGHWENGILQIPSQQNGHGHSGSSSFAVTHAKVLAAAEEARRAAQKAFERASGRVEERVNKVVAAANKAANAARVAAIKAVQKQMHQEDCTNPPILLA